MEAGALIDGTVPIGTPISNATSSRNRSFVQAPPALERDAAAPVVYEDLRIDNYEDPRR